MIKIIIEIIIFNIVFFEFLNFVQIKKKFFDYQRVFLYFLKCIRQKNINEYIFKKITKIIFYKSLIISIIFLFISFLLLFLMKLNIGPLYNISFFKLSYYLLGFILYYKLKNYFNAKI